MDTLALWVGYTVLTAGGCALAAVFVWACIDTVVRRLGYGRSVGEFVLHRMRERRKKGDDDE